jgi:hypothetical protein
MTVLLISCLFVLSFPLALSCLAFQVLTLDFMVICSISLNNTYSALTSLLLSIYEKDLSNHRLLDNFISHTFFHNLQASRDWSWENWCWCHPRGSKYIRCIIQDVSNYLMRAFYIWNLMSYYHNLVYFYQLVFTKFCLCHYSKYYYVPLHTKLARNTIIFQISIDTCFISVISTVQFWLSATS